MVGRSITGFVRRAPGAAPRAPERARGMRPATENDMDRAVGDVAARATEFARLPVRTKALVLHEIARRVREVARPWVEAGCRAKGIRADGPLAGEEWLAGPALTIRCARLLAESLEAIDKHASPPLGRGASTRPDGRVEVGVFPTSAMEAALFSGFTAKILLQTGRTEAWARDRQAPFYRDARPAGRVTAVLGAGNVSSIPPADVFHKMFVEGHTCVLKMNPVNEWVGPILEQALVPLIDPGWLRIVYGGADVGGYLVGHAGVDDVHITGSDRTFDLIVWGPPGAERENWGGCTTPT